MIKFASLLRAPVLVVLAHVLSPTPPFATVERDSAIPTPAIKRVMEWSWDKSLPLLILRVET